MTLLVFVIGILVFLLTVYGTVVVGGLLLTDRQLDAQPELNPPGTAPAQAQRSKETIIDRARSVASSEY